MSESQPDQSQRVQATLPSVINIDQRSIYACEEYMGVIIPMIEQVRTENKLREMINKYLMLDPDEIDRLSLKQLDQILFILPKALIWIQDCENEALIAYTEATDAFEDTISTKASLLPKTSFDVSQVTEKMRLAKIREMFPTEFEQRTKEVRTRYAIFKKLSGQVKHLERLNDNVKKIRESFVNKLKTEKEGDTE